MNKLGRELLYACAFLATCMWCARGQLIKGCPMYGCKSSGSFSFVLPNVPMNNVGVVWTRKHVSTMLPDGVSDLGCVGNEFNVICNAHTGTSNGYIAVDPVDGSISWTDKQLHDPALPLMTQFGDIIATDGKALVYYYSNGSSNGDPITFMYDFTPVYSLTLSSNYRFFIHSASEGIFLTYGLDGIVDASMYLNETINGMKGAFVPIAQPVIYGSRIYSLMRFKSEDGFLVADETRLYAVDITEIMNERLKVAWYLHVTKTLQYVHTLESSPDSSKLCNGASYFHHTYKLLAKDKKVYMLYPGFTQCVDPMNCYETSSNSLWIVNDGGQNGRVLAKVDINNGKDFAVGDNMHLFHQTEGQNIGNMGRFSHSKTNDHQLKRPFQDGDDHEDMLVWVHVQKSDIIGIDENGMEQAKISLSFLLFMSGVSITSKIMLVASTTSNDQMLLFAISVDGVKTDEFLSLCNGFKAIDCSQTNFIVGMDPATSSFKWMVSTPNDVEVFGQMAGVSASLRKGGKQDVIVAYGRNSEHGTLTMFAIGELLG